MQRPAGSRRARRGARPRIVVFAALLTGCAVVISACTVGPSRRPPLATSGGPPPKTGVTDTSTMPTMPTGPGGPGRTSEPIEWSTCPPAVPDTSANGSRFEINCADLTVPLSYADPTQGSLAIRVARARTARTPADAAPLVVLLGDPGQHGRSEIADVAATIPTEIRNRYTLIVLDLRGTGASNGIDCVSDASKRAIVGLAADPSSKQGADQLAGIARQLTFDCGDLVGPALTQFDSTNAADDLDTLRASLGVRTVSILGRGYGATIGAVYADRYPGRISAMVLDSPTDPLATPGHRAASAARAAQSLLGDFAAACPGFDGGCPLGADPVGAVTDLVRNLATSGQPAGGWVITGGSVLMALLRLLPDQPSWPALADALAQLGQHHAEPLGELLTGALGGERLSELLTGRLLYRCNDTGARLHGTQLAEAVAAASAGSALFGPLIVALAGLCSAWPAPEQALGRLTAAGAPPILLIGSVKDPLHPYPGVQSLAGQLPSAVLVSWQSGADGAYPANSCVRRAVDSYLLDAEIPTLGLLCPP